MTTTSDPAAAAALSDAILAIAAERAGRPVLQRLVHAARELADARYAALGIPDGQGGFSEFITSGMTEAEIVALGPLPRTHGLLGAMLTDTRSFRTDDIRRDPRFRWWPPNHPQMRSFLGVPIVSAGEILGAFYLTDKRGAPRFSDADLELIERFAAHAAVAIDNARLWERSRELAMLEERTRIARDLHDAMTQTLFSLTLTAETAADALDRDAAAARASLQRVRELSRLAMGELRSLISELRPADLEADGLVATLRSRVEILRHAERADLRLHVEGDRRIDRHVEQQLYRVTSEALHNAVRHASASRIDVTVALGADRARVSVRDDGVGFDPDAASLRATRLGLESMRARAAALGGTLSVRSRPGSGTTVVVEVPLG